MQTAGTERRTFHYPGTGIPDEVNVSTFELQSPNIKRESVAYEAHKAPFKEGGPFLLRRYSLQRGIVTNSYTDRCNRGWRVDTNVGNFKMQGDFSVFGLPNILSEEELSARFAQAVPPFQALVTYGEAALNRINPLDLSESSIIQSIIELYREGLPHLPGMAIRKARDGLKASGGEYLNVMFGWTPLALEIKAIYDCYNKMNTLFQRLKRQNNKCVRRKATIYKDTTKNTSSISGGVGSYPLYHYANSVPGQKVEVATVDTEETTRIWVVGAGKYYIPDIESVEFKKLFIEQIYGARPSLSILYELMPWSWLLDYFTNVGDVIQYEFGPKLGTYVHEYAYLMRHKIKTVTYKGGSGWTYDQPDCFVDPTYKPSPPFIAREVYETKERIAATPYGFGSKLSGLSPKQLAILTALGISRTNFPK